MAGYSNAAVYGIRSTQVIVPAGNTNAVYFQSGANVISTHISYFSGNTLEIQQAPMGSTQPGSSFVLGSGYILKSSESLDLEGPVRLYFLATGATGIVQVLQGLSAPGY